MSQTKRTAPRQAEDRPNTSDRDDTGKERIPHRGIELQEHGALTNTDEEVAYARGLAEAGLEILLVSPGVKSPDDTDMVHARGLRKVGRGEGGRHLATSDPDLVEAYVRRFWHVRDRDGAKALNLGVRLGHGSRLVVADADTPDEVAALNIWWKANLGGDLPTATVSTPGGGRDHKDGGHWWFVLPEGYELPEGLETAPLHGEPGKPAATLMVQGYVLIPPSVRAEGPYRITGEVLTAPQGLLDLIDSTAAKKHVPRADYDRTTSDSPIDAWAASVTWDELLTEAGWTLHHAVEACGCPTWTRPGATDPKSAVAHGDACARGDDQLHVWSHTVQNDWGTSNLTKARFIAHVHHGGNLREALDTLGIDMPAEGGGRGVTAEDLRGMTGDPVDVEGAKRIREAADESRASAGWGRIDLTGIVNGSEPPTTPTTWRRADGLFLLYPGLTHTIHGESESGKSLVMQALSAEVLNAGDRVLFLDYESDAHSVVSRLRELGADPSAIIERFDYRRPEGPPDADRTAWDEVLAGKYALIVIDGVTASLGTFNLSGMDNDQVNAWTRALPRKLAEATGAPLAMVDHVTKSEDGRKRWAIGAQAKMADITGAAYTVDVIEHPKRGGIGKLRLRVGKDRPGFVRPRCADDSRDHMQVAAEVIVDSTGKFLVVSLNLPEKMENHGTTSKGTPRDEDLLERISAEAFRRRNAWMDEDEDRLESAFRFSMSEMESSVKGRATKVRDHVKTLANEGYLEADKSGFRVVKEYRRPLGGKDSLEAFIGLGPKAGEAVA